MSIFGSRTQLKRWSFAFWFTIVEDLPLTPMLSGEAELSLDVGTLVMATGGNRSAALDTRLFLADAQAIALPLENVLDDHCLRIISSNASAVGCPPEFLDLPTLTIAAGMIGVKGRVMINPNWAEPCIVWIVVAARKGKKKTAALSVLSRAVKKLEDELVGTWISSRANR